MHKKQLEKKFNKLTKMIDIEILHVNDAFKMELSSCVRKSGYSIIVLHFSEGM